MSFRPNKSLIDKKYFPIKIYKKKSENAKKYDVNVDETRCKPYKETGNICDLCFNDSLLEMIEGFSSPEMREFLEYQLEIDENKNDWLKILKDIMSDNKDNLIGSMTFGTWLNHMETVDKKIQELEGIEEEAESEDPDNIIDPPFPQVIAETKQLILNFFEKDNIGPNEVTIPQRINALILRDNWEPHHRANFPAALSALYMEELLEDGPNRTIRLTESGYSRIHFPDTVQQSDPGMPPAEEEPQKGEVFDVPEVDNEIPIHSKEQSKVKGKGKSHSFRKLPLWQRVSIILAGLTGIIAILYNVFDIPRFSLNEEVQVHEPIKLKYTLIIHSHESNSINYDTTIIVNDVGQGITTISFKTPEENYINNVTTYFKLANPSEMIGAWNGPLRINKDSTIASREYARGFSGKIQLFMEANVTRNFKTPINQEISLGDSIITKPGSYIAILPEDYQSFELTLYLEPNPILITPSNNPLDKKIDIILLNNNRELQFIFHSLKFFDE